jgi:hypothetical protein
VTQHFRPIDHCNLHDRIGAFCKNPFCRDLRTPGFLSPSSLVKGTSTVAHACGYS